jgi:formylglycine-generating enzyme required for sulfatase activity
MRIAKRIKQSVFVWCILSAGIIGLSSILCGCQEKKQPTFKINTTDNTTKPKQEQPKKLDSTKTIDMGNNIKMELILIPADEFEMGSPESDKDRFSNEGPAHKVKISRQYYMGKYEVTQEQYTAITGTNPSVFSGTKRPVEDVNWVDATAFCNLMSSKYGEIFRLPTEAEWEYAARALSPARFSFGDDDGYLDLLDYAWFDKNSLNITHPVGQKRPNLFGLYDMYGNVAEWCSDWYDGNYYQSSPTIDPNGPAEGTERVYRGGGWINTARSCRSTFRSSLTPGNNKIPYLGFRIVMEAK